MLARTDQTMRTFTDVLQQSNAQAALKADRPSPIEARAEPLASAAERMAGPFDHERVQDARRKEAVD